MIAFEIGDDSAVSFDSELITCEMQETINKSFAGGEGWGVSIAICTLSSCHDSLAQLQYASWLDASNRICFFFTRSKLISQSIEWRKGERLRETITSFKLWSYYRRRMIAHIEWRWNRSRSCCQSLGKLRFSSQLLIASHQCHVAARAK